MDGRGVRGDDGRVVDGDGGSRIKVMVGRDQILTILDRVILTHMLQQSVVHGI